VHGHANVIGATVLPHNIVLGATGDADLIRRIAFAPGAKLALSGPQSRAGWRITYQIAERPRAAVTVSADGDALDITQRLAVAAGKGWREMVLTSACLGHVGDKLTFGLQGSFTIEISEIVRDARAAGTECSF
jgi:beta-glucosidase